MSYSRAVKNSYSSFNRPVYTQRTGFNRNSSQSLNTQVENMYLPRKCGFTLPFDPTISMDKYLCAVGDLVGDKSIVFAGKNNDHLKFYLKSEFDVIKLYDNHAQVVIDSKPMVVRKLIDDGHKVHLCCVEPGIPDSALIQELSKYTKVISNMRFLNLGSRNERFSHVASYKRQVFVDSIDDLPTSFNIHYENIICKIFIMIDRVRCFICNEEGHLKDKCPTLVPNSDDSQTPKPPADKQNRKSSIQDRISSFESAGTSTSLPTKLKDDNGITNLFVPAFGSRNVAALNAALTEGSVSPILPAPLSQESNEQSAPASQAQVDPVGTNAQVGVPAVTKENVPVLPEKATDGRKPGVVTPTGEKDAVSPSDNSVMDVETRMEKGTKRHHESSPPPAKCIDKKVCTNISSNLNPDNDLDCIIPVIEETISSVKAEVIINLMNDVRNFQVQKKLEIISDKYNMEPNEFISVLSKILSGCSGHSVSSKILNRIKNLKKALVGAIMDSKPSSTPPMLSQS